MRKIIFYISGNRWARLFYGLVAGITAFVEIGETILEDVSSGEVHAGHGVFALAIFHILKALSEFVETSEQLEEGLRD